MNGATVFRRNGPAWRFTWDRGCRMYVHRTTRGTSYAIVGINEPKPVWIARRQGRVWYTVEKEIRAERIQFDNGDEYFFGGKLQ